MDIWLRNLSVGQWYEAHSDPFEIVGIDPKAEIVFVRYDDGVLDELRFDAWEKLDALPIPPPGHARANFDTEFDEFGDGEPPGVGRSTSGGSVRDAMDWLESHGY